MTSDKPGRQDEGQQVRRPAEERDGQNMPREELLELIQKLGKLVEGGQAEPASAGTAPQPAQEVREAAREEAAKHEEQEEDHGNRPVTELSLVPQARSSLAAAGIRTAGELAGRSEQDLLGLAGLGPRSVSTIKAWLAELGLSLSTQPEPEPVPQAQAHGEEPEPVSRRREYVPASPQKARKRAVAMALGSLVNVKKNGPLQDCLEVSTEEKMLAAYQSALQGLIICRELMRLYQPYIDAMHASTDAA